jgi:leader peptidase (prepilin peptidase)/N-methyltransferase
VPADVPRLAVALWAALVGGAVGSFLNVVIARVPAGESVVSPGSRCPRCRRPIAWYDNVPVVSWLVLRGRCRGCRAAISVRYPLVELLGALAGLAAWWRHGLSAAAAAELLLVATLLALAFIDLDTWLLPHALTWPLIPLGVAAAALGVGPAGGWRAAALGAGIGFGLFATLSLVAAKILKKDALGFGDVWLLAGIGAWLGVAALLPVILLASIQGAVVGVALLAVGRAEKGPDGGGAAQPDGWVPPRNAIPFGPFLVLATLEWLYGAAVIAAAVPALDVFR